MDKKKLRKLQTIPGNGKGIKFQGPQPIIITITAIGNQVQVNGFPSNLDATMDLLHAAEKAVRDFFIKEAIIRASQGPSEVPKKRGFLGPRPY